jgi:hypothetical protein
MNSWLRLKFERAITGQPYGKETNVPANDAAELEVPSDSGSAVTAETDSELTPGDATMTSDNASILAPVEPAKRPRPKSGCGTCGK